MFAFCLNFNKKIRKHCSKFNYLPKLKIFLGFSEQITPHISFGSCVVNDIVVVIYGTGINVVAV